MTADARFDSLHDVPPVMELTSASGAAADIELTIHYTAGGV